MTVLYIVSWVTLWFSCLLLTLSVELNIWLLYLSTGYSFKCYLSHTGSLWEGECPLLWQVGWRPDRLPHPSSIWASNSSVPDRIAPSYRVPLKCRLHGEQWAVSPHSSTRQPPSDQCRGGAGSVPRHLGPAIQCRPWTGLQLLQNPADCGGGQNRWEAGGWGEGGESDMDAGDSWARGLLVWSRILPRASSVGLMDTRDALAFCNQQFELSQNGGDTSAPTALCYISDIDSHIRRPTLCKLRSVMWVSGNTLTLS